MDRHQADSPDGAGRADSARRELIALDLDGTLIDARVRQVGVAREALAYVAGARLDEPRFWRTKRRGATTAQAIIRLGYDGTTAKEVAARWAQAIESDGWLANDRALPGAARVLRALRDRGARVAVLTARHRPEGAERSLEAAGLVAAVDELVVVEPGPTVVDGKAVALRRLQARAFVGDTDTDGAAARVADVPFVAVSTGQRSPAYLRKRGYEPVRSLTAALEQLGVLEPRGVSFRRSRT